MSVASHATIGALVAVAIKQPAIVFPLAFLSHFVADMIPHFGYPGHEGISAALKHRFTRAVLWLDPLLLIILAAILIHFSAAWYVYVAAFLAISPDVEWLLAFLLLERRGITAPRFGLTIFHEKIQWAERPWGYFIELCVIAVSFALIIKLLS